MMPCRRCGGMVPYRMKQDKLTGEWLELTAPFINDSTQRDDLLSELLAAYQEPHRKYHNLSHILDLLRYAHEHEAYLTRPHVVKLAIFYHDIIYNVRITDNEEKSAQLALNRLSLTALSQADTQLIKRYIVCTKSHKDTLGDSDLCYFLDFDLSILGAEEEQYNHYAQSIRKEYDLYPDKVYNAGRKKVLQGLLQRSYLFATDIFRDLYEKKARQNILKELDTL